MKPRHDYVSSSNHFALGVDLDTGRPYVSFPVGNALTDYEEYYRVTPSQYEEFLADPASALEFVDECRRRQHDDLLVLKPGRDRGTAW